VVTLAELKNENAVLPLILEICAHRRSLCLLDKHERLVPLQLKDELLFLERWGGSHGLRALS
jgi:hypothetical protein